jgi:hypothetical protein
MQVALVPVLLGRGEQLFDELPDLPRTYVCSEVVRSPAVVHLRFSRAPESGT